MSRASFYRHFPSRESLLEALELSPEPDARKRILTAAVEMAGARGVGSLSMDELADRAGLSRATVYRVFPGRGPLVAALIDEYSPLEPVSRVLAARPHDPPSVLMPELARTALAAVYAPGENRAGLIRALFFEVSGLSEETQEVAAHKITKVVGQLVTYLSSQMAAGRLRRMHPLVALQAFIGPILFHILTRPLAETVLHLDIDGEAAVTQLAEAWLRAMSTEEKADG